MIIGSDNAFALHDADHIYKHKSMNFTNQTDYICHKRISFHIQNFTYEENMFVASFCTNKKNNKNIL